MSEQVGERRSMPRVSTKLGRSGEGVSKKGDGVSEKRERVGRKGIACSQSLRFNQTLFTHELGAIVQFDWLVTHQKVTSEIWHPCTI